MDGSDGMGHCRTSPVLILEQGRQNAVEKLSTELERHFFAGDRAEKVTLEEILTLAGERAFGFLFILLSLPSALPVPAPGYSVPFGIVMLSLAVQLVGGATQPWLPDRFSHHTIDLKQVQGVLKAGLPWLRRVEVLTRPRLSRICHHRVGRIVIGVAIALMSISMMIPIPLTNTLPAIGIFITAFGLLDEDGFISLIGLTVCALGATVTSSILIFGLAAVRTVIDLIKAALTGG